MDIIIDSKQFNERDRGFSRDVEKWLVVNDYLI